MENLLDKLNDVPGVRGSFICDRSGRVLSAAMPESYHEQLDYIGREVVQVVDVLEMLGEETDTLDFLYSDGRILVNGLKDLSLIVVCEPDIDISMIRLKSNVTLGEVRRDTKSRRQLQRLSKTKKGVMEPRGLAESYREIMKKLKALQ